MRCKPGKESESILKFVIDCEVENDIIRYPLELRINDKATEDMPNPPLDNRRTLPGFDRPGLSDEEILNLSNEELVKRGYPKRPASDNKQNFNHWRKIVSKPARVIEPNLDRGTPFLSWIEQTIKFRYTRISKRHDTKQFQLVWN